MSSMYPVNSKFESVDAALNYLREPSSPEVVSSSTTSSTRGSTKVNHGLKSTKKQKKEKESANVMKIAHENTELLSSGRVRYGPITVNPRKQPSKTLFTGRRSKYEQLSNDEEEKRRLRRERNRVAATKCREKREYILTDLETEYNKEQHNYMYLSKMVEQLQQRKQYLLSLVSNQYVNGSVQQINPPTPSQQPSKVFGDSNFLTSMQETSIPLLPPQQIPIRQNEEEEFSGFLQPTSSLTNTAYNNDQTNYIFNTEQQSQQTLTMNSSSLERLISSLQSPTPHIDNNNNTYSGLFNSAYGSSSSCAQQHSSSSEDDSLPPARKNSYVF